MQEIECNNPETIEVLVGTYENGNPRGNDYTKTVKFEAEKLSEWNRTESANDDSRGVDQSLYVTPEGRLIVHTKNWSRWQGESTTYRIQEIMHTDLEGDGDFYMLGKEAGISGPLTLDQGLDVSE